MNRLLIIATLIAFNVFMLKNRPGQKPNIEYDMTKEALQWSHDTIPIKKKPRNDTIDITGWYDSTILFSTSTSTWVVQKKRGYVYADTITGEVRYRKGEFKNGDNKVLITTVYY